MSPDPRSEVSRLDMGTVFKLAARFNSIARSVAGTNNGFNVPPPWGGTRLDMFRRLRGRSGHVCGYPNFTGFLQGFFDGLHLVDNVVYGCFLHSPISGFRIVAR